MLKIIVITIVVIMLIIFSILIRKQNKRTNEEFKDEDDKTRIKETTSKIDILEDSNIDIGGEGGNE